MTQCNFYYYLFFKPFCVIPSCWLIFFPKKQHLKAIGIEKRGHRKRLLIDIEKLPQVEIPQEVPVSRFTSAGGPWEWKASLPSLSPSPLPLKYIVSGFPLTQLTAKCY